MMNRNETDRKVNNGTEAQPSHPYTGTGVSSACPGSATNFTDSMNGGQ